jgi:hypothetical protein
MDWRNLGRLIFASGITFLVTDGVMVFVFDLLPVATHYSPILISVGYAINRAAIDRGGVR